jgi:benzoyl-CoA reductase subunit B
MSTEKEIVKEESMLKQKAMIARNYDAITSKHETGKKVVSTFVPGNLNELVLCFDMLNNLPEINASASWPRATSRPTASPIPIPTSCCSPTPAATPS